MEQELKDILDYQTKLLEQIVLVLDDSQVRSARHKKTLSSVSEMILQNPMINKNPQAREVLQNLMSGFVSEEKEI